MLFDNASIVIALYAAGVATRAPDEAYAPSSPPSLSLRFQPSRDEWLRLASPRLTRAAQSRAERFAA
jgi:hypothetical protein